MARNKWLYLSRYKYLWNKVQTIYSGNYLVLNFNPFSPSVAPAGCLQYFRNPSDVVRSFNYGPKNEGQVRYLSNLRYTSCVRVEENFCSIKWETETPGAFSWGAPHDGGASGSICNEDDFVGIDQGSEDGDGPGEDRFCGTKLHERDLLICEYNFASIYPYLPYHFCSLSALKVSAHFT